MHQDIQNSANNTDGTFLSDVTPTNTDPRNGMPARDDKNNVALESIELRDGTPDSKDLKDGGTPGSADLREGTSTRNEGSDSPREIEKLSADVEKDEGLREHQKTSRRGGPRGKDGRKQKGETSGEDKHSRKVAKENKERRRRILYWNDFYGSRNFGFCCGTRPYVVAGCGNTNCQVRQCRAGYTNSQVRKFSALHGSQLWENQLPGEEERALCSKQLVA